MKHSKQQTHVAWLVPLFRMLGYFIVVISLFVALLFYFSPYWLSALLPTIVNHYGNDDIVVKSIRVKQLNKHQFATDNLVLNYQTDNFMATITMNDFQIRYDTKELFREKRIQSIIVKSASIDVTTLVNKARDNSNTSTDSLSKAVIIDSVFSDLVNFVNAQLPINNILVEELAFNYQMDEQRQLKLLAKVKLDSTEDSTQQHQLTLNVFKNNLLPDNEFNLKINKLINGLSIKAYIQDEILADSGLYLDYSNNITELDEYNKIKLFNNINLKSLSKVKYLDSVFINHRRQLRLDNTSVDKHVSTVLAGKIRHQLTLEKDVTQDSIDSITNYSINNQLFIDNFKFNNNDLNAIFNLPNALSIDHLESNIDLKLSQLVENPSSQNNTIINKINDLNLKYSNLHWINHSQNLSISDWQTQLATHSQSQSVLNTNIMGLSSKTLPQLTEKDIINNNNNPQLIEIKSLLLSINLSKLLKEWPPFFQITQNLINDINPTIGVDTDNEVSNPSLLNETTETIITQKSAIPSLNIEATEISINDYSIESLSAKVPALSKMDGATFELDEIRVSLKNFTQSNEQLSVASVSSDFQTVLLSWKPSVDLSLSLESNHTLVNNVLYDKVMLKAISLSAQRLNYSLSLSSSEDSQAPTPTGSISLTPKAEINDINFDDALFKQQRWTVNDVKISSDTITVKDNNHSVASAITINPMTLQLSEPFQMDLCQSRSGNALLINEHQWVLSELFLSRLKLKETTTLSISPFNFRINPLTKSLPDSPKHGFDGLSSECRTSNQSNQVEFWVDFKQITIAKSSAKKSDALQLNFINNQLRSTLFPEEDELIMGHFDSLIGGLNSPIRVDFQHKKNSGSASIFTHVNQSKEDAQSLFQKLGIKHLSPMLAENYIADGDFSLALNASWKKNNAQWDVISYFNYDIENATAFAGETALMGINSKGRFELLPKLRTFKNIPLSIDSIHPGVELSNLTTQIDLTPSTQGNLPSVSLIKPSVNVFSGSLSSEKISLDLNLLDLNKGQSNFVIDVDDLDLTEIVKQQNIPNLQMNGRIHGKLPVLMNGNALEIKGGHIETRAPGQISYQPEDEASIKESIVGIDSVLLAFKEFNYNSLTSDVDYDSNGELKLALKARGISPLLDKNRPVELNLNVTQNIKKLLQSLRLINNVNNPFSDKVEQYYQNINNKETN